MQPATELRSVAIDEAFAQLREDHIRMDLPQPRATGFKPVNEIETLSLELGEQLRALQRGRKRLIHLLDDVRVADI